MKKSDNQKRTNNITLPGKAELKTIIDKELLLPIPTDKENIHYPKFDTIIRLFEAYALPTDIFIKDLANIYEAVVLGEKLLGVAVDKIMNAPPNASQIKLFNNVYDYLSEADEPQESDLIFAPGAKTMYRAEKAVELYKNGLAPKIIASGHGPAYAENVAETEAQRYKKFMIEQGVPESAIIVEDKSITVPDNIWRTLDLLEKTNEKYESIILVNSPYSQRRVWSIFRKFTPDSVKLYRVNAETRDIYDRESWYKQPVGLRVVLRIHQNARLSGL